MSIFQHAGTFYLTGGVNRIWLKQDRIRFIQLPLLELIHVCFFEGDSAPIVTFLIRELSSFTSSEKRILKSSECIGALSTLRSITFN
jgi:hypothetical protein